MGLVGRMAFVGALAGCLVASSMLPAEARRIDTIFGTTAWTGGGGFPITSFTGGIFAPQKERCVRDRRVSIDLPQFSEHFGTGRTDDGGNFTITGNGRFAQEYTITVFRKRLNRRIVCAGATTEVTTD